MACFVALTQWSTEVEDVFRVGYGVLLLLQLLMTARQAKRFFSSEIHGGYFESSPRRDQILRPNVARVLISIWICAAFGILLDRWLLLASVVNFAFARYFFVRTRWQSILRGMGAPGHMNHWIAAFVMLLAVARAFDSGELRAVTLLTFRIDFAFIMFMAGVYKLTAGYAHGEGFERGLVNPWWGFWARPLARLSPHSIVFRLLNHAGWMAEVGCSMCFLIVPIGPYAALLFLTSFLLIALTIRLTFLAEMVAWTCLIYIYPHGWIGSLFSNNPSSVTTITAGWNVASALSAAMIVYLVALPFAYGGMSANFYWKRRLPSMFQRALDWWCGLFGLILWRVFTADVTNFYTEIFVRKVGASGDGTPYFRIRAWDGRTEWRYMHVGEFICLASIFTTLKYYPNDRAMFERRIVRYTATLPIPEGSEAVFAYHAVVKGQISFEFPLVTRFVVDPHVGTVHEEVVDASIDIRSPAAISPISPGRTPGSYAPT